MATIARHIRSSYDPETERDDLLLETGQVQAPDFSDRYRVRGGIDFDSGVEERLVVNGEREDGVDPWLVELPYAPAKFNLPVKFVKAVLSYEDLNDYIERGHESGLLWRDQGKGTGAEEERKGISDWYRNLSRTNFITPAPAPVQEESAVNDRSAMSGTLNHPISSFIGTNCSVIVAQERTSDALSQSKEPLRSSSRPSSNPRQRNDWFISNALPRSSLISSGSNSPVSRPPPTLADMLARDPPPKKSQEAYTPPPWIMLPPSNPGFRMLQKSGWSEGEPLGPYFARKRDLVRHGPETVAGPSNLGKRKAAPETRTTEIEIEGYDSIVEIKTEQVIDLTLSDGEESASSDDEDKDTPDEDLAEFDGETARLSSRGEGHGGKALLTPLPTILKSDRLGIGLKAKTVGPYRTSQKRVTHNAAALAAHIKGNEERRLFKQKVGRGSRGFSRMEKHESEKRKGLLSYLNQ